MYMYKAGVIDNYEKRHSPASSSIDVLSYYSLPSHFLVLGGKINMFFLGKLRMELKCHRYDVTDVDIFLRILPCKNDFRY